MHTRHWVRHVPAKPSPFNGPPTPKPPANRAARLPPLLPLPRCCGIYVTTGGLSIGGGVGGATGGAGAWRWVEWGWGWGVARTAERGERERDGERREHRKREGQGTRACRLSLLSTSTEGGRKKKENLLPARTNERNISLKNRPAMPATPEHPPRSSHPRPPRPPHSLIFFSLFHILKHISFLPFFVLFFFLFFSSSLSSSPRLSPHFVSIRLRCTAYPVAGGFLASTRTSLELVRWKNGGVGRRNETRGGRLAWTMDRVSATFGKARVSVILDFSDVRGCAGRNEKFWIFFFRYWLIAENWRWADDTCSFSMKIFYIWVACLTLFFFLRNQWSEFSTEFFIPTRV